jgi:hypothetical protein
MSRNRYAKNVDGNHRAIVNALRMMGCSVEVHSGSTGSPDLVVGCFGVDQWAEVKPPVGEKHQREVRESQAEWHARWRGRKPVVLRTVADCAALVAQLRGAMTSSEVARD